MAAVLRRVKPELLREERFVQLIERGREIQEEVVYARYLERRGYGDKADVWKNDRFSDEEVARATLIVYCEIILKRGLDGFNSRRTK